MPMSDFVYDFNEQLRYSSGVCHNATVDAILLREIPGDVEIRKADLKHDKKGTDWWVIRKCGRPLSVDAKVRRIDYAALPPTNREDDLALETFSVVESNVVGWTRDESKQTDYILWLWTDTGRWCLVPFVMLCSVFCRKWQDWKMQYKTRRQETPWNGTCYHSECVFVPRLVVWREIYNRFGGAAPG